MLTSGSLGEQRRQRHERRGRYSQPRHGADKPRDVCAMGPSVGTTVTSLKSCSRLRRHFLNFRAHQRDAGWESIRLRLIEGLAGVGFGVEHDD